MFRDVDANSLFGAVTPNWYASIMGTGIVGNAAATLPLQFPGLRVFATAVWGLSAILLVALVLATAMHWLQHPDTVRGYLRHPVFAHFLGAAPMALLTVGSGTLLLGTAVIGEPAALSVDVVLWIAGTAGGLALSGFVTYLLFTGTDSTPDDAFAGWLMPIVPPMVSAAGGALLVPHVAAGQLRMTLLLACYAMFGLTLVAALLVTTMLWSKLVRHGVGPAAVVPTLWIVLGPLGQSITAANLLGDAAHSAIGEPYASAFEAFGVVYGVPVLGFALFWVAIVTAITVRTVRQHLPFSLTWWSFTFPVGTCVTGTSALAAHTGSAALAVLAVALYVMLLAAWAVVALRTAHGSIISGRLLVPVS